MSLKQKMWQSVAEYFESTSIHGFSHLRASKTLLGRLLWILIIGSCFSLAALLICESIEEANDNPILTNIETISVQDIPFPAVTIKTPEPNIWRHFAKILNGLAFDQVRSELPEDNKLVEMISPIIDYGKSKNTKTNNPAIVIGDLTLPFVITVNSIQGFNETCFGRYNCSYAGILIKIKRTSLGQLWTGYFIPMGVFSLFSMISFLIKPDLVRNCLSNPDFISKIWIK